MRKYKTITTLQAMDESAWEALWANKDEGHNVGPLSIPTTWSKVYKVNI